MKRKPTTRRDIARRIVRAVLIASRELDGPGKRKALREAYPWGERKRSPYRVWCEEVRLALAGKTPSPGVDARQLGLFEGGPA